MDFTNWNKERQALKDEIFKDLREQQDRQGASSVSGTVVINPHFLTHVGDTHVYGPFLFGTKFKSKIDISFGQVKHTPEQNFVVVPYVEKWVATQGSVEGFYLGVYALIAPPEGLTKHSVSWKVDGKASLYRSEAQAEAWKLGYSEDKADHLYGSEF